MAGRSLEFDHANAEIRPLADKAVDAGARRVDRTAARVSSPPICDKFASPGPPRRRGSCFSGSCRPGEVARAAFGRGRREPRSHHRFRTCVIHIRFQYPDFLLQFRRNRISERRLTIQILYRENADGRAAKLPSDGPGVPGARGSGARSGKPRRPDPHGRALGEARGPRGSEVSLPLARIQA